METIIKFIKDNNEDFHVFWENNVSLEEMTNSAHFCSPVHLKRVDEENLLYETNTSRTITITISVVKNNVNLYLTLLSTIEALKNESQIKVSQIKHPSLFKKRLEIKPEYEKLAKIIDEKNDEMQKKFESIIFQLEKLISSHHINAIPRPRMEVIPQLCYEWEEYRDYAGCGVLIYCEKKSDIYNALFDSGILGETRAITPYY